MRYHKGRQQVQLFIVVGSCYLRLPLAVYSMQQLQQLMYSMHHVLEHDMQNNQPSHSATATTTTGSGNKQQH